MEFDAMAGEVLRTVRSVTRPSRRKMAPVAVEVTSRLPRTSRAADGAAVPIPSRLFVLSQKKFELPSVRSPPAPANGMEPSVNGSLPDCSATVPDRLGQVYEMPSTRLAATTCVAQAPPTGAAMAKGASGP